VNNNYNSNTVVKQDFVVVKQVDGRAAHMTNTTRHQSWQSTPLPDHAGSIPGIIQEMLRQIAIYFLQYCVRVRMKLDEKYDQNFDVSNDSLNVEIHTTLQL
jgi:hypothetical protein